MAYRLGSYTGMCQAAAAKLTPKGSIYRAGDVLEMMTYIQEIAEIKKPCFSNKTHF